MSRSTKEIVFQLLTEGGDGRVCKDIPESACEEEASSFAIHVASLSASKVADGLIDPKLVLSWILATLGAPAAIIGLLVPVREAGALLPQLFTAGHLRRLPKRKWAWATGAFVQGVSALAMGVAVLTLKGAALGIAIISALAVLALARSVCSVTYKDVLGKTVSKSRRGTATGTASSASAAVILLFGALLATGQAPRMELATVGLFLAGLAWIGSAFLFVSINEQAGATEGGANGIDEFFKNISLLWKNSQLRQFILTRGLLISTALAPPFMVSLGVNAGFNNAQEAFGGLGFLVIASASAGLLIILCLGAARRQIEPNGSGVFRPLSNVCVGADACSARRWSSAERLGVAPDIVRAHDRISGRAVGSVNASG